MSKRLEWREENEKTRQTHHRPLLCGICNRGMAAAVSYYPCRLREGWSSHLLGNPIVDLLLLGSDAGKENEISGVMRHAVYL